MPSCSTHYEAAARRESLPKVIWLRIGNSGKGSVIRLLTEPLREIEAAIADKDLHCVEL
jgi:predicted nuclease of predicted toxin-antitoxin system